MQSRIPLSKPLALVIIGLIMGLWLGLGSGYAVFYPELVNQRNKTLEARIIDLEESMAILEQRLNGINHSISTVDNNFEEILAISDIMNQLSSRVSTIESSQITLNIQFNDMKNQLNELQTDFITIQDLWNEVTENFDDLETAYYSVNNELEDISIGSREWRNQDTADIHGKSPSQLQA
jgi:chromosome segregation ATPase